MSLPNTPRPVWTEAERRAAAARAKAELAEQRKNLNSSSTRRGGIFTHPATLFLVACALFFFSYVVNFDGIKPALTNFFSNLDRSAQSQNLFVADTLVAAVPYLKAGLGVLAAWIIFMLLTRSIRAGRRSAAHAARQPLSMQEFIDLAALHNVSTKVAREAYELLLPHTSNTLRTRLTDALAADLHLSRHERADLLASLLTRTGRLSQWEARDNDVDTVLDLLIKVENSTQRSAPERRERPSQSTSASAAANVSQTTSQTF